MKLFLPSLICIILATHFGNGQEFDPVTTEKTKSSPPLTTPPASSTTLSPNTTSQLPSTTTSKPSTTTTEADPEGYKPPKNCPCDKTKDSCDFNCCCDTFCNQDQLEKFPDCNQTTNAHTLEKCFRTNIFFTHNTNYKLRQGFQELFCIVADNYLESKDFVEPKIQVEDLKKHAKDGPSWSFNEKVKEKEPTSEYYKYGDFIWAMKKGKDEELFKYKLPTKFNEEPCIYDEPIQFLEPIQRNCKLQLFDLQKECKNLNSNLNANTFISDILISQQNPPLRNDSNITFIEITSFACSEEKEFTSSLSNCKRITDMKTFQPAWDEGKRICGNILVKLHLIFIYNGTEGIQDIIAKVITSQIPTSGAMTKILQEFKVDFAWAFDSSAEDFEKTLTSNWPISGNPGYIVGKPVIMGKKIKIHLNITQSKNESKTKGEALTEDTGADKTPKEEFIISRNPKYSLTIIDSGKCNLSKRKPVLFGLNHNSHCFLDLGSFKTCGELQRNITNTLLGTTVGEFEERYSSYFGNPNLTELNDWTLVDFNPSQFERNGDQTKSNLVKDGCGSMIASLRINVAYANIGPVDFPHAKIFKILLDTFESIDIPSRKDLPLNWKLKLITKVIFTDFTQAPVTKVAHWPVISIKLPSDFFYPFAIPSKSVSSIGISKYLVFYLSFSIYDLISNQ